MAKSSKMERSLQPPQPPQPSSSSSTTTAAIKAKGPKACSTCAKAKARCIRRGGGMILGGGGGGGGGVVVVDKCERCHRLGKHCFSRAPAPPRVKKRPKRSRVAELEKRLDELSCHLEQQQQQQMPQQSEIQHQEQQQQQPEQQQTSTAATTTTTTATATTDVLTLEHLFPSPISAVSPPSSSSSSPSPSSPFSSSSSPAAAAAAAAARAATAATTQSPWPSPTAEAEALLQRYIEAFAHLFPFVVVVSSSFPSTTAAAADLQIESPLLFKAVMLVACFFEGTRQLAMAEELLSDIVSAALVEGRKTLDLLQALELLIAWFHFGLKSSQLINLLFLARSISVNLEASSYDEAGFRRLHYVRAFAGVYYLNTVIFTTNKRTDMLMSTAPLDEYCNALTSANEYPSDEYLVHLVRFQQLVQGIAIAVTPSSSSSPSSLPFAMVIESFRDQLDTFRVTLPPHIASIPTMQCNITVVEILLSDIAISEQHSASTGLTPTDRLHLLWSCVNSLRTFFQIRFTMFDVDRPRFLPIIVSDLTFAFITGIKLLALQVPGLDLERVGRELALDQMLSRQIRDLALIIQRRRSSSSGDDHFGGGSSVEDPLERLQRLLMTGQELVALQLSGIPMQEIAHTVVHEMSNVQWDDLS
ncbi:hypothetical protein CP532_3456 [Ophiocordyceps camponoti-leonardi (nom. inval.)]|nr:hypothetical protein CP532_3456 [Ophiocordyceps camponoti-leonardi (nom. inval.)]